jgi:hypothetical protein
MLRMLGALPHRDESRYILDRADVGAGLPLRDLPRAQEQPDQARFGEYRTARLVLQAWDAMEAMP